MIRVKRLHKTFRFRLSGLVLKIGTKSKTKTGFISSSLQLALCWNATLLFRCCWRIFFSVEARRRTFSRFDLFTFQFPHPTHPSARGAPVYQTPKAKRDITVIKNGFIVYKKWAIHGLFFVIFIFSTVNSVQVHDRILPVLDLNLGPLVSEGNALPTEPQPLPYTFIVW